MNDFFSFLGAHWPLVLVFLTGFFLVIILEAQAKVNQSGITPQKAVRMINDDEAVVVDVRSRDAFVRGHIVGAKHIPMETLKDKPDSLKSCGDKTVVLVCETGQQVSTIANKLTKAGYQVLTLAGGLKAWQAAELPLSRK
ncbi:MAG: rhodanese-like domain-containing protein [Gammaproteobacteria bacterium]